MKSGKVKSKQSAFALVDVGRLLRRSVPMDDTIRRNLSDTRRRVELLRENLEKFSEQLKDLEGQDKLSNFEIQNLMSDFNQAETLASSVLKKRDDTASAVIGKI